MRWLAGPILALLLFQPVLAQDELPDGLEMGIQVGYNNVLHLARVNPVTVTLSNNTADMDLSGQLVLEYNGVEYSTPLELPTPSTKRFHLYFPCDQYTPLLQLRIRTQQYTQSFTLGVQTHFELMQPQDMSVLVLTRQGGSLNALNQQAVARLYRDLYRSEVSELGPGKVFVSYLDVRNVDPSPKFFSRADVVVLADIDYQQVTPQLAAALSAAATAGTSVVFSLGLNGAGVAGSPLAELCPLQPTGTVQVSNLGSFGDRYGIAATSAPATFAIGRVAPGAQVREQSGAHPAVVQRSAGSGTVTALAFDFTQAPFRLNPRIAAVFLETVLPIEETTSATNWFLHPEPVSRMLTGLSEALPMQPGFVMLFLLAYIVLIGPLNFFILDRFKRRTLVWTTIPLIIILFSTLGMYTGYLRRGSNNVLAYFQEVHVYPGAPYAPYQTVMMAFAAERTNYTLEIQDESAFLYPTIPEQQRGDYFGGGRPASLGLFTGGRIDTTGQPQVQMTQGKWTSKHYTYQGNRALDAQVTSSLSAVPTEDGVRDITGSFTLSLPFDLADCHLLGPRHSVALGDLAGQSTHQLPMAAGQSLGLLGEGNYLSDQRQAFLILAGRSSEFPLQYSNELLLVGFTDKLEPLAEFSRPHQRHALSMVVVHLPYTPRHDTATPPQVRTMLTGGVGFDIYRRASYQHSGADNTLRQYILQNGSVLQFRCNVSGDISQARHVLLHLHANEPKGDGSVKELSQYFQVQELRDNEWRPISMSQGDLNVDVPLAGRRQIELRIVALQEVILGLPTAEAY